MCNCWGRMMKPHQVIPPQAPRNKSKANRGTKICPNKPENLLKKQKYSPMPTQGKVSAHMPCQAEGQCVESDLQAAGPFSMQTTHFIIWNQFFSDLGRNTPQLDVFLKLCCWWSPLAPRHLPGTLWILFSVLTITCPVGSIVPIL